LLRFVSTPPPPKCSSVRRILVIDMTFFMKLQTYSCSQQKIPSNPDDVNRMCFVIWANYFSSYIATDYYRKRCTRAAQNASADCELRTRVEVQMDNLRNYTKLLLNFNFVTMHDMLATHGLKTTTLGKQLSAWTFSTHLFPREVRNKLVASVVTLPS
jgi:hypothetical protein